jgi:hypothetical protein
MPDLKTFWTNPGGGDLYPDLDGSTITGRGTDPQVDLAGTDANQPLWPAPPVPGIDGQESPNSVSGLPSQPNRFEPTEQPPPLPTLQDRRPGTIDER